MPRSDQIPPKPDRRVAVLVYDGLCLFEFSSAAEVFGLERPEAGKDWYRFGTVSTNGKSVRTQYGGRLEPDAGLGALRRAGTIVIPGWSGIDVPVPQELVGALRAAHRRGARLLSICSGAFVLAATGLLDGRRATTHWRYAEVFRRRHPQIALDPDVLYVDNGQLLTSAGSAAGLDLCLHLVRRDFGSAMANAVARRLVIAPHREGGQAQFVPQPVAQQKKDALSPLLDRLRRTLDRPHTVAGLAASVAMSERSLLRRFHAATGTSPAAWLTEARLQHARDLLERTALSVEQVAERSGFGTAMTLRHHFRRKLGTSPLAYRRRFGARAPKRRKS
ncbi:transcriptional regulator FtrA [Tahibacter harae]|uniref:Transcriptional regulator FtrA n=1 Tax=Tahibacter harae TaxID=2963937 RepID=A0ABT1QXB5_9GAMM|nr:transcriptional regulator FtrA [Tahibacter harae]MCQ4166901.1 transcriptional regulator FtrA [Tahibacter harae]